MIEKAVTEAAHRKRWRLEVTARAIVRDLLSDADILVLADEVIGKHASSEPGLEECREFLARAAARAVEGT